MNIVFILIDDLGWTDLGCYGSSFYETPNLDRLAGQSLRFTDAYAAAPVCSPTRAALMSGKCPARVGVTQFIGGRAFGRLRDVPYFHGLPLEETSLATALLRAGYQTWHVGKWHLGDEHYWPLKHGFEVNIGGCGMGHPSHGHFSPWKIPTLPDGPQGQYLADRLTDDAINLIKTRDTARPFFLNLWHYAVHTPIQAPANLVRKYEAKAKSLGLDKIDPMVVGNHFSVAHKRSKRITRRTFQSDPTYAAMVENLDTNVGRVLDELDRQGLADETMVIFASDNGGLSTAEGSPTCNAPLSEGKGWMYEGGTRVCQFVRWPGRITAGETDVPAYTCDWYPTLLSAAGLPAMPEQHMDGVDLLPLLRDRTPPQREAIYFHYPHYSNQGDTPAGSMRAGDWKLIEHFEDGKLELFNLRSDIGEANDLSQAEPQRVQQMHAQMLNWRREIEAIVPKPNPRWREQLALPKGVDGPEV